MKNPASAEPVTRRSRELPKVVAASMSGTAIEFYDFFLYGTAAATIFGTVFFPADDPLVGTLAAFGTYAVGFVARPLGGVLFGQIGDRLGRKRALMTSLAIMGATTVLIGLVPSYASIGVLAPILLTVLRILQGLALGGEWGGAILLIAEHAGQRRRGFWASWAQAGGPLGSLLSTGVLAILAAVLPASEFSDWGWRVAFLLSAVLIVIAYVLRRAVEESPVYRAAAAQPVARPKSPLREVLRTHRKAVLLSFGACAGEKATYYTFGIFALSYLVDERGVARGEVLNALTVASVFWFLSMLAGGWLSDRFGRRTITVLGALGAAIWIPLSLAWLAHGQVPSTTAILVSLTVGVVFDGVITGGQAAFFAELFPTSVRCTGASLGYQLAGIVGGSLTPIVGVALLAATGSVVPVVLFVLAMLALTVVAMTIAGETRHRTLDDI
ncbi:MFS transporter [Amycolatopsis sp. YIM 10]|uniref:MFS transporter n=1 Tax=Amycolatopsis sp. YIM 10 TaxID=2653857 RepID=UPI0012900ECE|nr:MFS transporter [Amycolatopsis sp. YIM 10]QFU89794.1 Inner membrane metabolite transport protein YhjE [Amycolatopsis sp. YIM 10]